MIFFFFNDTATTEIYTLSLHDALPIFPRPHGLSLLLGGEAEEEDVAVHREPAQEAARRHQRGPQRLARSEEHTSELQSRQYLVCRLLLEKKKKHHTPIKPTRSW